MFPDISEKLSLVLGDIIETTNIYARINVEQMRDALEKAYPELTDKNLPDWSDDNDLMDFLTNL